MFLENYLSIIKVTYTSINIQSLYKTILRFEDDTQGIFGLAREWKEIIVSKARHILLSVLFLLQFQSAKKHCNICSQKLFYPTLLRK